MTVNVATASQTIGPFWHLLEEPGWADLTRFGATGRHIVLHGRITDGDGAAVSDACVELWQADPPADDHFPGFGRAATDPEGRFRFVTMKPGPLPGRDNVPQAPHVTLALFARGLLSGLFTRAYFQDDALNETDPLLSAIADPARRDTLIAVLDGPDVWRLDIRLQGAGETVFLDI